MMIQLDLFEKDEISLMLKELARMRESNDKVRRGLFAKHNELERTVLDLEEKIVKLQACNDK